MNHVAFNVHKRISNIAKESRRAKCHLMCHQYHHADNSPTGYVSDPNDDRISWRSFYFFGPDGEYLELTSRGGYMDKAM